GCGRAPSAAPWATSSSLLRTSMATPPLFLSRSPIRPPPPSGMRAAKRFHTRAAGGIAMPVSSIQATGPTKESDMEHEERLWLSGFATVREALGNVPLGVEEVRQALERDLLTSEAWLAPWKAGFEAGIRVGFGS